MVFINIKDNLGSRGQLRNVPRTHIKEIKSRVLTHEGEVLSGSKSEHYRNKYIKNRMYAEPVKRQGNWADLPKGALPSD